MNQTNETETEYIQYVNAALDSIDKVDLVTSYDTGFGLTITDRYIGQSVHILDVRSFEVLKIRTPKVSGNYDLWEKLWFKACEIVRNRCSYKGEKS